MILGLAWNVRVLNVSPVSILIDCVVWSLTSFPGHKKSKFQVLDASLNLDHVQREHVKTEVSARHFVDPISAVHARQVYSDNFYSLKFKPSSYRVFLSKTFRL